MKQFLTGGLIGGSVVLAAVVLMGQTPNRGSEVPTIVPSTLHQLRIDIVQSFPTSDMKSWKFLFYNPTSNPVQARGLVICM